MVFIVARMVALSVITSPLNSVKYCDEYVCLSPCLFVCPLTYLKNLGPKFIKLSVQVVFGSVLLWRRYYISCTSGFVDDVIFSHNMPYGASCLFFSHS